MNKKMHKYEYIYVFIYMEELCYDQTKSKTTLELSPPVTVDMSKEKCGPIFSHQQTLHKKQ